MTSIGIKMITLTHVQAKAELEAKVQGEQKYRFASLQADRKKFYENLEEEDIPVFTVRCKAARDGCSEAHERHFCKVCKNRDANHLSRNCRFRKKNDETPKQSRTPTAKPPKPQ